MQRYLRVNRASGAKPPPFLPCVGSILTVLGPHHPRATPAELPTPCRADPPSTMERQPTPSLLALELPLLGQARASLVSATDNFYLGTVFGCGVPEQYSLSGLVGNGGRLSPRTSVAGKQNL